jgi:glutamyl/glutaminyl-tRNA synthetase
VQHGHAYPCFCSAARLAELREEQTRKGVLPLYDRLCANHSPASALQRIHDADASHQPYVIRLRIPAGATVVKDVIRGGVRFENRGLDDQVLLKSDGYPTYHLAVVVDDHAMGVTHVIRGEEWMTSAPKHVILYKVTRPAVWSRAMRRKA